MPTVIYLLCLFTELITLTYLPSLLRGTVISKPRASMNQLLVPARISRSLESLCSWMNSQRNPEPCLKFQTILSHPHPPPVAVHVLHLSITPTVLLRDFHYQLNNFTLLPSRVVFYHQSRLPPLLVTRKSS